MVEEEDDECRRRRGGVEGTGGESESEIGRVRNWLKGSRVFRRHSFPGNQ